MKNKSPKIQLKISDDDGMVAYLKLPKHPKNNIVGCVKKTISLSEIIKGYIGIPIYLDFDKDDELIELKLLDNYTIKSSL